jgi:hypothetical protein
MSHRPAMDPDSPGYSNDDPTWGEEMSYHDDEAREEHVRDEWRLIREQQALMDARAAEDQLIAMYRRRHPEVPSHVKDTTVLALLTLEAIGRRSA